MHSNIQFMNEGITHSAKLARQIHIYTRKTQEQFSFVNNEKVS